MARNTTFQVDKFNSSFAFRLRGLLAEANLSESDLGKAIGVSKSSINYYCQGSSQPNFEKLTKIAKHFGVSTDYLLGLSACRDTDQDIWDNTYNEATQTRSNELAALDSRLENAFWECYNRLGSNRSREILGRLMCSANFVELVLALEAIQEKSAEYSDCLADMQLVPRDIKQDSSRADTEDIVTRYNQQMASDIAAIRRAIGDLGGLMQTNKLLRYRAFDAADKLIDEIGLYSTANRKAEAEMRKANHKLDALEVDWRINNGINSAETD